MKCEEVKNLLSHYLEDDLDIKIKKDLDEHLFSCPVCAKELAELKEILLGLKKTPQVQPPPYFLEAVRARLEEKPALLERILKRLFLPFHIKVPLEALVVTATVIIIFVLVQKGEIARLSQPEMPGVDTRDAESLIQSEAESMRLKETYPQEMAKQTGSADYQAVSRGRYAAPVLKPDNQLEKVSERTLLQETKEGKMHYYKNAFTPQADKSKYIVIPEDIKNGLDAVNVKKERLLNKVILAKEIIVKSRELSQDSPKLEVILRDLEITDIKTESYPDKVFFSFSIPTNQLEPLLSNLKDWQILSSPAKEPVDKDEILPEPIPIRIILTTQETP